MTVRELWDKDVFGSRAYTTIMTTTDRLFRKGLLCRESKKKAYQYWPSQDRDSYWKAVSQELMSELMELGGAPILTAFVEAASDQDQENLDRLEAMIQQRRKEQESS